MATRKVLVIGATGTVGSAVIAALAETGAEVRAMVRDTAKAEKLRAAGIEVVAGDYDRPETLGPALSGIERVFLLSAPNPRMADQEKIMTSAAAASAERPHLVKLSAIGAALDSSFLLGRIHGEAEQAIVDSGLAYTFLRPNGFMQNLFGSARAIREGSIHGPAGEAKESWIDARDIADVAVKALTENGHNGKTYILTGPEAVTYPELAQKFSTHLGREIRAVTVPPEVARPFMLKSGMSEWLVDGLLDLFVAYQNGLGEVVTDTIAEVTGQSPRTLDHFIAEYANVFNP